jgi:hypothetical protein
MSTRLWLLLFCFLGSVLDSVVGVGPPPATCFTYNGYVTSEEGVECAECFLKGHLDPDTLECIFDDNTDTAILELESQNNNADIGVIISTCENVDVDFPMCLGPTTECVNSKFGTLCSECGFKGYLIYDDHLRLMCKCYSSRLNPTNGCGRTILDQEELFTAPQILGARIKRVSCQSFDDPNMGCFKPVDLSSHKYGDEDPPIPRECCTENFGPPPNELLEAPDPDHLPDYYEECNIVGGIDLNVIGVNVDSVIVQNQSDPLYNATMQLIAQRIFKPCHNHGSWNATTRECTCYRGWQLGLVGEYPEGTELESCVACSPFYGPDTYDSYSTPPYCSKIYTPNPYNGQLQECGGGGSFNDGRCDCFGNQTHGFFEPLNLTRLGVTVETCGVCTANCPL